MAKVQSFESLWLRSSLWKDQFQLIALCQHEVAVRLRAASQPVDARGGALRAVGFDGALESSGMQLRNSGVVQLKQRLAPSADHERLGVAGNRPMPSHCFRQRGCR